MINTTINIEETTVPSDTTDIINCNCFVMVENLILSRNYSSTIMDDLTFRRFLLLQLRVDGRYANTNGGHREFRSYTNCKLREYKDTMRRLEYLNLISTELITQKVTRTSLKMAKIYDESIDNTLIFNNYYKTSVGIEKFGIHYASVPKEAMKLALKDKSLSLQQHIRLLLKLYKYNNLALFNGIDPNLVHRENKCLYIHPRILHDLRITQPELEEALNDLVDLGYLFWRDQEIYTELFDLDSRLMICNNPNEQILSTKVQTLVPVHQYVKEENNNVG